MRRLTILALASAAFAGTAGAQTSVDIRTGPNGQLSGSASAGGTTSRVGMGNPEADRAGLAQGARSEAHCSGNGRTMTVTSPDGSSSSSVSTSSSGSGGMTAVSGGGSPGSRVSEGDCDGPVGRRYGASAASSSAGVYGPSRAASQTAVTTGRRPATRHHRRHRTRHHSRGA